MTTYYPRRHDRLATVYVALNGTDEVLADLDNPQVVKPASLELAPVFDAMQSSFSAKALSELQPLLNGIKTVKQDGSRIALQSDGPTSIPIGADLLNKNIVVTSLHFGDKVAFDYDSTARKASKIDGITLNVTVFGSPYAMPVDGVQLGKDDAGNKILHTQLKNPLPEGAQRIIGMPSAINVDLPLREGGFSSIKLSQVFSDVASATGPSIAGLLTADALKEGGKVALFAESNPKWINQVVEPAMHGLYRRMEERRYAPTSMAGPAPPGNTAISRPPATVKDSSPAAGSKQTEQSNVSRIVDLAAPGDHVVTTLIDGKERQYRVHVPPSYDKMNPLPLVVLLHGHAQSGEEIGRYTKINALADKESFISVCPDGTKWLHRDDLCAWDTGNGLIPPGNHADDVAFMRHIIEDTEKNFAIDSKRIYMCGLSNGGMMSFRAAGELSDKLAAIAAVSGAMSGKEPPPKFPMSVLNIHGTDDPIVPYQGLKNVPASLSAIGLPNFKPMEYTTNFWVEQNKITAQPVVSEGNGTTQRRFIDSKSGLEVNEYTLHGNGHIPDDIDGVVGTIWEFFKAHPKADGTASGTAQPPEEEPFNITERLKAHVRARGSLGLELDAGDMLNEIPTVPDGSFSPASSLAEFEKQTGVDLKDPISDFLKSTGDVSKRGSRLSFTLQTPQQLKIEGRGGSGPVKLSSIDVGNTAFDLINQNGRPWLNNIEGINFNFSAFGREVSVPVKEVGQKLDGAGAPYYQLKADNPLPSWARTVMFSRTQIPVEFKLSQAGVPSILNERQIKDATLGWNPVSRGYIDVGSHARGFFEQPSWKDGLHLAKDVGVVGGTGYACYRLAAMKFASKGRYGIAAVGVTLLAPAIIHGIERLID